MPTALKFGLPVRSLDCDAVSVAQNCRQARPSTQGMGLQSSIATHFKTEVDSWFLQSQQTPGHLSRNERSDLTQGSEEGTINRLQQSPPQWPLQQDTQVPVRPPAGRHGLSLNPRPIATPSPANKPTDIYWIRQSAGLRTGMGVLRRQFCCTDRAIARGVTQHMAGHFRTLSSLRSAVVEW